MSEGGQVKGTARASRRRVNADGTMEAASEDIVALEEPLEIRIGGEPIATTMRTPGDDHRLTLGFLFAEGLIESLADVSSVSHCGRPLEEGYGNIVEVTPGAGFFFDMDRVDASRRGTINAACGVCGRQRIDDLMARATPVTSVARVRASVLLSAPKNLRHAQKTFGVTGAVHGAAVLDPVGHGLAVAEDVGRHNAVDKVVGRLLLEQRLSLRDEITQPPAPTVLVVSGRTSFEIIQKAAMAQLPIVVAVGGPTSLAITLAQETGITLCGFVREDGMNVYTHPHRLWEDHLER